MVAADLERRLGGPVGAHARRRGIWFDPAPWAFGVATLVWALTLLRQSPCQQHVAGQPVNAFMRLCYSDVPVLYQTSAIGTGGVPFRDADFGQGPLAGFLVMATRGLAQVFGARPVATASQQQLVDGGHAFLMAAAVLLFCCLLVLVGCVLLLGRGSDPSLTHELTGRVRSRDAWFLAASPGVFTAGLVSWDLFAVALLALALLGWSLRRPVLAGVLWGLAIAAGLWPVLALAALYLVCVRAGRLRDWWPVAGAALATAAAVTLLAVGAFGTRAATGMATTWLRRRADLGSVWFVLDQVHVPLPGLSYLVGVAMLAWLLWVAHLVLTAPRRPRLAQVAFLLVAGWLLVDKGFAPQQVLWLALLVPLARPNLLDWTIWSGAEALYWWAVWGHLGGQLAPGDGSPDTAYWAAIVLRVMVLLWLVVQVAGDVRRPWQDEVRRGGADDPIGGVLAHQPDRSPLARPAPV